MPDPIYRPLIWVQLTVISQNPAHRIVSSRNEKAKKNHLTTFSLRCLISRPAAEKLFFKKIPLILMGLGRGGATPATPNVFGNCFLLHPVNNPVRLPSNKMNIQHSCSVQNRPSMPRFVSSRNGKIISTYRA